MNSHCCPEGRWLADPHSTSRALYAPDIEEMLRAPLADLFWGTIEYSAVNEAVARAEAMIRHLELRRRVLERRAARLMAASGTPLACEAA